MESLPPRIRGGVGVQRCSMQTLDPLKQTEAEWFGTMFFLFIPAVSQMHVLKSTCVCLVRVRAHTHTHTLTHTHTPSCTERHNEFAHLIAKCLHTAMTTTRSQLFTWIHVSTGPRTTVVSRHFSMLTDLWERKVRMTGKLWTWPPSRSPPRTWGANVNQWKEFNESSMFENLVKNTDQQESVFVKIQQLMLQHRARSLASVGTTNTGRSGDNDGSLRSNPPTFRSSEKKRKANHTRFNRSLAALQLKADKIHSPELWFVCRRGT